MSIYLHSKAKTTILSFCDVVLKIKRKKKEEKIV